MHKKEEKIIEILKDKKLSTLEKIQKLERDIPHYLDNRLFSAPQIVDYELLPIIGIILYKKQKYDNALPFLEKSSQIEEKSIPDHLKVDIFEYLANLYERKQQINNTIRILEMGADLAEKIDDKKGSLYFLSCLGTKYLQIRDFKKSIQFHQKSLELSIQMKDKKKESICLNHIGVVYYTIENYEKALDYFLKSFNLRKRGENKLYLANTLNNIGAIYHHLAKFEDSIKVLEQALELHTSINNKLGISNSLNNIGIAYDRMGKYHKALEYHLQNLKLREKSGEDNKISTTLSNIGNVYKNSGNFDEAKKYYQQSLNRFEKSMLDSDKVILFTNMGSVYLELQQYPEAFTFLDRSLTIAEKINSKDLIKAIYNLLSEYYYRIQDYQNSLKFQRKYSELQEEIHEKNTSKKILELQLNFEIEQQEKEKEIAKLKSIGNKYSLITKDLEQRIERKFIGESRSIKHIIEETLHVAKFKDTNVIITGESGTGKEIIARIIHHASSRKEYGFFPINCSAVPETLLESEFFGHKKGSFTGAINDKKGLFELAQRGTLFLDEIADMPLSLQAKLLRVLEEKKVKKIGSEKEIFVEVRIIAATNRNLDELITKEQFRLDLYHRINTFIIEIPPLRERPEDIEPLMKHYTQLYKNKFNMLNLRIDENLIEHLRRYHFPGNVRELKNLVERAIIICKNNILDESCFPILATEDKSYLTDNLNIKQNEERLIKAALQKTNNNQTKAAKLLGISRHTLIRKLTKIDKI